MALPKRLSGSLFTLGECGERDRSDFAKLLSGRPNEAALVEAIFQKCELHPELMTDMASLVAALGISRPALLKRLAHLEAAGLITSEKQLHSNKQRNLYTLRSPADIEFHQAAQRSPEIALAVETIGQTRELFPDLPHVEYPANFIGKSERFFVLTLVRGLRMGRTGKTQKYRRTRVYRGDAWFDIEVRAAENTFIPSVIDTRVLIVAMSLVRDYALNMEGGHPQSRGYVLEMSDICLAMGLDPTPGNKNSCFAQLSRWRSSEFVVRAVMRDALRFAQGLFEIDRSFSVIDELTVEHLTAKGKTANRVHVIFNRRITEGFKEYQQYLTTHHEILHERQPRPLKHLIYYWCRTAVQHRFRRGDELEMDLRQFHREIRSDISLRAFKGEFKQFMGECHVPGIPGVAKVPGYFIAWDEGRGIVGFRADPEDPVVGANSLAERYSKKK